MKIYLSGGAVPIVPEVMLREHKPDVMLTFYDLYEKSSSAKNRFRMHRVNRVEGKCRELGCPGPREDECPMTGYPHCPT